MQQPVMNDRMSTIQMSAASLTTPVASSTASASAVSPAPICVTMSNRLRSTRSANTPPTSVNNRPGSVAMKPSTPSQNGDPVNFSTSHPCATVCIHVPAFDRNAPAQNTRKFRCDSARNIPPTRLARGVAVSMSTGLES